MYMIDLHNHTLFSYDGSNTPEEIIENAINNNIDVVGITDHDFSVENRLCEYFEYITKCKDKYSKKIKVLCGLEISARSPISEKLPEMTKNFDYVLFELLDTDNSMDFFEFIEFAKKFKCAVGLAHTDIFKLGEKYNTDIIKILYENNIFWELNTSGNYNYYYDFLTNKKKRRLVKDGGIAVSVGSDTHYVAEYRKSQIKRANALIQDIKLPMP